MPIKKENRQRYPKTWKALSLRIRRDRAKWHCEWCGKPDYRVRPLCTVAPGGFWRQENGFWRNSQGELCGTPEGKLKEIKVILTVAHLDHTPENCDPANLAALCQSCHLSYDAKHRKTVKEKEEEEAMKGVQGELPI